MGRGNGNGFSRGCFKGLLLDLSLPTLSPILIILKPYGVKSMEQIYICSQVGGERVVFQYADDLPQACPHRRTAWSSRWQGGRLVVGSEWVIALCRVCFLFGLSQPTVKGQALDYNVNQIENAAYVGIITITTTTIINQS